MEEECKVLKARVVEAAINVMIVREMTFEPRQCNIIALGGINPIKAQSVIISDRSEATE